MDRNAAPRPGAGGQSARRFRELDARAPGIDTSWGLVSFAPPSPTDEAAFDAARAYQLASHHGGRPPSSIAGVMLAMAHAQYEWPDGGPAQRLVYVVRWDGVTWMPSGPPMADGRGQPGPVVGTQTTVIDAISGAWLGTSLTGARASLDSEGDAMSGNSPAEADLASVWADRSDMDDAFIVKAGAISRGVRHQVLDASTTLDPLALPARLTEIGTTFAGTLRALDEAVGPFIGAQELADIVLNLQNIVDSAERAVGRPLPRARVSVTEAAQAVLTR